MNTLVIVWWLVYAEAGLEHLEWEDVFVFVTLPEFLELLHVLALQVKHVVESSGGDLGPAHYFTPVGAATPVGKR